MKQISDDILIKALELREQGRSPEQIFAVFPEARVELQAYFKLTADLQAEAKKIAPPAREVLRGALRRAAAIMRGAGSMPTAEPDEPTASAARRVSTPVPQPASSTRSPGLSAAWRRVSSRKLRPRPMSAQPMS